MKKAFAIFFLTFYLLSTTELSQLLKLPAFVNHYIELTLWQFFCIHYAHGNVRDADYDKDMKLPFKTLDSVTLQISVDMPPSLITVSNKQPYDISKKNITIPKNENATSAFLSSIWQPPKTC